jgi:heme/copper-type cytochrome/quinol oxidase subunit 2
MAARLREMISAPASTGLVVLMVVGCLFLWVGIPLGWLWIGSQVQSSASLGTALMVTMLGIMVTMVALIFVLAWINRRHVELQERRNRPIVGSSALEVILVSSAGIAVVLFGIWFFGFAGASPVPVNIGF